MKKLVVSVLIAASLLLSACGRPAMIDGKNYPTYGLVNADTQKSADVCYELSVGNVVWSLLLVETVVMPIYFIGFDIYNPIGKKGVTGKCGIDAK